MKQVPYQGPTILESLVNPTIIVCFLLGACDLFLCRGKTAIMVLKILGATVQKYSWLGNQMPGTCETLLRFICSCYVVSIRISCVCVTHTQNKIPTIIVILNSKLSLGTPSEQDNLQLCERVSSNRCHFRQ